MRVVLSDRIVLTDEASESSYGRPVAIIAGKAHGPSDRVGDGGHAGQLVQAETITARLHRKITTDDFTRYEKFPGRARSKT